MNDIVIPNTGTVKPATTNKFTGLSDDDLKVAFARCCGNYFESIVELAQCVQAADARGLDLSDVRLDIYPQIRRVADGAVLPEVVTMYGWKKTVYDRIAALSIAEQKKIVQDGHVPVLVLGANGETTTRMMSPTAMRPEQLRQVFADDHVRTDAEQAPFLDVKRIEARKQVPEAVKNYKIDKVLRKAKKGRLEITFDEIDALYKAIHG
jgi:hypothetical protein